MKLFFKNGFIFLIFFVIFGEITSRVFHITTDAPKTFKNKNGNIRYYPNQEGYWDGGSHKWYINSMGFPAKNLPNLNKNVIKLIGDSYIQNFMNPDSCRQREFLSNMQPTYNFLEASMAGFNLLSYFEMAKEIDSIPSKYTIMYVNTRDFLQSVKEISNNNATQWSQKTNVMTYPKYMGSKYKDVLYNFKFLYFLYRKNIDLFQTPNDPLILNDDIPKKSSAKKDLILISELLTFIKANYKYEDVILVLHPTVKDEIFERVTKSSIKCFRLANPINKDYKTNNHGHWNCYGHKEMARQVSDVLDKLTL